MECFQVFSNAGPQPQQLVQSAFLQHQPQQNAAEFLNGNVGGLTLEETLAPCCEQFTEDPMEGSDDDDDTEDP